MYLVFSNEIFILLKKRKSNLSKRPHCW